MQLLFNLKIPNDIAMFQTFRHISRQLPAHRRISSLVVNRLLHNSLLQLNKVKPMVVPRDLPDPSKDKRNLMTSLAVFAAIMTVSLTTIFNYEKTQNPIIDNTMYQLRRSSKVKELMGSRIEMGGLLPWIHGTLNPMAGKINIKFNIVGEEGKLGLIRLVADRENREQNFMIHQWSLEVDNQTVDLLKEGGETYIG